MNDYVVLISRHFYDDSFTTQFRYRTFGDSVDHARNIARIDFPSIYFIHPIYNRLVAYFTGIVKEI